MSGYIQQAPIGSATFAGLPATAPTGQISFLSNVGTKGSHWYFDGTRWKPVNGVVTVATLDTASNPIANSDTVVFQYGFPAALLTVGDRLRLYLSYSKSGTADNGNFLCRLGTAGTTGDTAISGGNAVGTAQQSAAFFMEYRVASATTILQLANSGILLATSGYTQQSSTAVAATVTISNISNALFFSVTISSSGATNTVSVRDATLQYLSSAN